MKKSLGKKLLAVVTAVMMLGSVVPAFGAGGEMTETEEVPVTAETFLLRRGIRAWQLYSLLCW